MGVLVGNSGIRYAGSVPPPTSFFTTFPATENPISESALWVNGLSAGLDWNNVQTGSGNAIGTAFSPTTFDDNIACLLSWGLADYFVEGVVNRAAAYAPTNNHEIELLGRFAISAHVARGYEVLMSANGNSEIVRWNGTIGSFLSLAQNADAAVAHNDVVRVEFSGNSIVVKKNGVTINTAVDPTWAAGAPGVGMFCFSPNPGAALANLGWQSLTAGPL